MLVERPPEQALPHGRQTHRLADISRLVGLIAGGLPGSRFLARLAMMTSDDTLLRRVKMRLPLDAIDDPIHSIGVEQDYGTILIDLDRDRVADLRTECSAEEWQTG